MSFYEDLVMQTQMNYSRHYNLYASGRIPYALAKKTEIPYEEQIRRLVKEIAVADCVLVGGASVSQRQAAVTFIMRTMLPTENISANMQRNIILMELLTV